MEVQYMHFQFTDMNRKLTKKMYIYETENSMWRI